MIPTFAYKAPELPAAPIAEQSDLDAHPDTLRPAWDIYTRARAIAERITPEGERLTNDPNLSEAGKREAFTKLALPAIKALKEQLAKLDGPDAVVMAEAEAIQKVAAVPQPTDSDERLAESFGRRTEQQRLRLLEGVMTDKDPKLLKALASAHPILHGLGEPTVAILRGLVEGAQLDPAAVERVKDTAFKLNSVRRTVTNAIDAMENAADRAQLAKAGVATLRRSDLTTAQKAEHIDKHGLAAFKALPS